jgi:hypothetical protein
VADTPTFQDKDIPFALAALIQALIVQLMEADALTLEQGQRVFDAAAKRAKTAKGAGEAVRLIEFLSDQLPWDEMFAEVARKRPRSDK